MGFSLRKNTIATSQNKSDPEITCIVVELSDTGPSRSSNEDNILYFNPSGNDTVFAMVADGMGGHNAGEIASSMACNTIRSYITAHYKDTEANELMLQAMLEANKAIAASAALNAGYAGMGTTATAMLVTDKKMHFAQVGDSRLYHYRNNILTQCTTDQTLVTKMMQEGTITAAEAEKHSMKHILSQALGSAKEIVPVLSSKGMPVMIGDRFLLCSDGMYECLKQEELQSLMAIQKIAFIAECIRAICFLRSASDNFSVIIVEITDKKIMNASTANSIPTTKEQNVPS